MKSSPAAALRVILLTLVLDYVGFGILLPIGALLFTDPTSPQYLLAASGDTKAGYVLFGLLVSSYPLAQFLAAPLLGQLSDRYGRKPVLSAALAGTALSYCLFALGILSGSIPLLFAARILDGITGANVSVAQAALADVTEPKDRPKTFGMAGAALGIGITFGPLIGGTLSDPATASWFSAATPFWFAAILSLLNLASVRSFFNETHPPDPTRRVAIRIGASLENIGKAFSAGTLRTLFITGFLFTCGFAFYTSFAPVFLVHRFGFDQSQLGRFFFSTGIMVVATQALVPRLMARHFGERQLLRVSLFAASAFPLLYVAAQTWWHLLVIFPFFSSCVALSMANLASLVSKSAGPGRQGETLGINASVQGLAQSVPPIIGGLAAAQWAYFAPLIVSAATLFLAGLAFVLWYRSADDRAQSLTAQSA